mmetsp:Transcript_12950/g.30723  ORF Transcript_12950/g.30723 Transcript_12950/m.30723 type:complete len:106 (+) Transcript_12950:1639-1956(+)
MRERIPRHEVGPGRSSGAAEQMTAMVQRGRRWFHGKGFGAGPARSSTGRGECHRPSAAPLAKHVCLLGAKRKAPSLSLPLFLSLRAKGRELRVESTAAAGAALRS